MRTELLTMLRETKDYVSGQKICETFGVSRTAVWKAVNQLRNSGYEIEAVSNKGYRLLSVPDVLNQNELLSRRKTKWIGKDTLCYETIDSTNAQAKRLAEAGYGDGTLIVADHQEAGRGRRGRSWETPAGTNIAMSLLLKPEIMTGEQKEYQQCLYDYFGGSSCGIKSNYADYRGTGTH